MDADCNYHALENLFADDARAFRGQVKLMTETYFEPLKRRNSGAYAEVYSRFYADMLSGAANFFKKDFSQSLEQAERGELTDDEMKTRFAKFRKKLSQSKWGLRQLFIVYSSAESLLRTCYQRDLNTLKQIISLRQ